MSRGKGTSWEDDTEKGSGNSFNLQGGEGVLPVSPYQSHSSESLTWSPYSRHNNLHRVQCVCVHVSVNNNKQQGQDKICMPS